VYVCKDKKKTTKKRSMCVNSYISKKNYMCTIKISHLNFSYGYALYSVHMCSAQWSHVSGSRVFFVLIFNNTTSPLSTMGPVDQNTDLQIFKKNNTPLCKFYNWFPFSSTCHYSTPQ
jgi:hypothetical protein